MNGSECYLNGSVQTCAKIGTKHVRVTASAAIPVADRLEVKLNGIANPTTGSTGYFKVYTQNSETDQIIEENDAFAVVGISSSIAAMTG